MNKLSIIILLVGVLIVGGVLYVSMTKTDVAPENSLDTSGSVNTTQPVPGSNTPDTSVENQGSTSAVKEFTVEGSKFAFKPNTMVVKKGDRVRITFKNIDGMHDFRIDEFGVATKQIQGGKEETVEFTADKAGSFEYYCSVGTHRQMGMKGTLTVTE